MMAIHRNSLRSNLMVQLGEQHRRQCNFSGREEKDGGNVDGHTDEVLCIIIITTRGKMRIWTDHDPHILYDLQFIQKVVVGLIILLLVVYTFYRLLHVWLHTLNFSEVKGLGG